MPNPIPPTTPARRVPRPDQNAAIDAAVRHLKHPGSRGHLVSACGTGKTLIALRTAEALDTYHSTPGSSRRLRPALPGPDRPRRPRLRPLPRRPSPGACPGRRPRRPRPRPGRQRGGRPRGGTHTVPHQATFALLVRSGHGCQQPANS
ncbi:DEAD/DEAH box helicase family protein [Streptomyces sp. NPDC004111]|uniref:DEAD/DEAH box helicase family protein n=1 Tax=Streptomyces sp. NPDC004111 TaxID=3364690 RepID=UPI00368F34BF